MEGMVSEQAAIDRNVRRDCLVAAALRILKQYHGHPRRLHQDWILSVLSNQNTNAYLKEIADRAWVRKNLTFHIVRHTFASSVTLSNGCQ